MTLHSLRAVCWIVIYAIAYYKHNTHRTCTEQATIASLHFKDEFLP